MADVMVTGRMDEAKKNAGLQVLAREGLNASQAVNLLFERLAETGNADFLTGKRATDEERWRSAARYVDGISRKRVSRFDTMTKAEIKRERLAARGLMGRD
ncbi:type II toxin-antitoxin system RelB/DinJ family antitoxin [Parvibacter caecicola]|uniref:Antitoxin component of RelBE/YafQ-DinJ toxin-antitoxin module n=1 Tax=Parvibacter caecicola TaxID=747645 RepID=A0A7W5D269_9ACTN|nr:type II toxin-antitoxin system RelB/DinJ family antitoxin [Parvibacter caecicola]MBB3171529.1 antitoxin component of RelBE/YafQ-DinJ toxin-antitoxin module [Parvibacter caecicola]MCR2040789.1 type II toxin-antitoxin system RelB/DinJ family antitoxin [Parvibacter caecicola]RNL11013.1 RelB/DinJ family addiction module antitoxin [Parvibacter caecicola]